mmetsp:Transcript_50976/g.102240  ORF Transcript_50976/g.102240 Transcript_50976/m.102240 type:complete len:138 (+) Transcript_50976:111-524(+)
MTTDMSMSMQTEEITTLHCSAGCTMQDQKTNTSPSCAAAEMIVVGASSFDTPSPFEANSEPASSMMQLDSCFGARRGSGIGYKRRGTHARRKICSPLEDPTAEYEYVEEDRDDRKKVRAEYNEYIGKMLTEELMGQR